MFSRKFLAFVVVCNMSYEQIYNFNVGYQGNDAHVSYETSWGKERFIKEDYIKYFPYYKRYIEKMRFVNMSKVDLAVLPSPYSALSSVAPYNNFGMYFNSEYIEKLMDNNTVKNVIEIGSYYGLSTRHIASLLPDGGVLYAVDSWEYFAGMYEQFLSNIVQVGLTDVVVPVKAKSEDAVILFRQMNQGFDLIYVDGDHETLPVVQDLELYFPLLSEHGVICGDDWLLKTVRDAVVYFAKKHNLTIYSDCNFWFLKNEGQYQIKSFLEADLQAWIF